jgi:hypothetical protein
MRPPTGAHRRATIAFGSDRAIRSFDSASAAHDSSDEVTVANPRKAK